MKILACTIPERGHLNPLLPTLRALSARGHDVMLATSRDVGRDVGDAAPDVTRSVLDVPPPPPHFITHGADFAIKLRDDAWLARWIEALLIDAAPSLIAPVRALIDDLRPDVCVFDPMLYGAVIAATEAGVPWAAVSSSLNPVTPRAWRCPLTDTLDALDNKRRALWTTRGLTPPEFRVSDAISPWCTIAFTCGAYAPHARDMHDVHLCGAPFDVDAVPAAHTGTIYASFGSQAFHQPSLFDVIFQAATHKPATRRVIASVGSLIDDDAFVARAPNNAVLHRYAPQLAILPTVDAVISHGGANSVVESLAFGKPIVLLPLCNDQHLQARFLRDSGAGVVIDDPFHATADHIYDALNKTTGPDMRNAAAYVANELKKAGGPQRAATLIEGIAR